MRSLHRLLAASALSVPLVIGAAGIASADVSFGQSTSGAGPDGAATYAVGSAVDEHGNTYYYEYLLWAGPNGAGSSGTSSSTGGHGDWHGDWHGWSGGGVQYHEHTSFAGPDGAFSTGTSAHADNG